MFILLSYIKTDIKIRINIWHVIILGDSKFRFLRKITKKIIASEIIGPYPSLISGSCSHKYSEIIIMKIEVSSVL